jgi:hypothetical protein
VALAVEFTKPARAAANSQLSTLNSQEVLEVET